MSKKFLNREKSINGFKKVTKVVGEEGFKTIKDGNFEKLKLSEKFKFTFQMFGDVLKGRYREFSIFKLILSILAIIYVVSPFDFIPDVIFGLGWIDDGTIFALGWNYIKKDVLKYKMWKDNIIEIKNTEINDNDIV